MSVRELARVGIDIGGTFTDFAVEIDGHCHSAKVLTTSNAPERGVLDGLSALLGELDLAPANVGLIIHGTTLATNALIERRGALTAFVTTEGFRDIVEVRGEDRYEQYDLTIDMPRPLVPRNLRFVVPERIDAHGRVRRAFDEDAAKHVADTLKAAHIEAVAVGFLHSYVNPEHEQRFGAILARALPDLPVTLSCEVSPEMREYERFSTACANAFIQPRMGTYLDALETGLKSRGFACPLLLMQSSGGLTTVETARRFPVRLVESGPAGGAIFAGHIATRCGIREVLSFDMGGTTAKICLIDNAEAQTSRSLEAARIYRFKKGSGIPLRIPVIEMVEIGAGGGSIARVDDLNRITVGPDSAGSEPGPACYGQGGSSATVTDADLVIGKIDPAVFAGGRMALDVKAAGTAIQGAIGAKLKLPTEIAAFGISEIVDENMSNAARVHSIESGKDVRKRTIIAFGGAAPLHVARVAESLGVECFIVPRGAGVGSAVGFLLAPISYEIVRSLYMRLDAFAPDAVNKIFSEMGETARSVVEAAVFQGPLINSHTAYMRYVGQGHELPVPIPSRSLQPADAGVLEEAFAKEYRRQYSRIVPGMAIEILTWALRTSVVEENKTNFETRLRPLRTRPGKSRDVLDRDKGSFSPVPIVLRDELERGVQVCGPALIVEDETTTLVSPAFTAEIDEFGNIVCSRNAAGSADHDAQ
jgi:N-methylhydantoinase A